MAHLLARRDDQSPYRLGGCEADAKRSVKTLQRVGAALYLDIDFDIDIRAVSTHPGAVVVFTAEQGVSKTWLSSRALERTVHDTPRKMGS